MQLSPARRALLAGGVVAALVLPGATPAQAADTGAVSGRLTTNAGTAAAEVLVQVYPADGYESVGQTNTDADGNYTVSGLPAGSYTVGYFPWTQPEQYHHRKAMMWDADPVTVAAGGTTTVDEQLFGTGTLSGRIVDNAGQPVRDLLINAHEVDTYNWAGGLTDEDGRFTISALPGRYRVNFNPIEGSYQTQYVPGSLDEERATIFQVAADSAVEVNETVLPVGGLSGRFTTATGAPLTNASVDITTANMYGGTWTETDANGEFDVQVLQGSYKVGVISGERQQYYRGKLTAEEATVVQVGGGRQTTIADSLLGTGSVAITAVDSVTGAPVANFCVDSACSSGGTVTVTGLPQGRHDLFLYAPDKLHFPRDVTGVRVTANGTTSLTVKMRPGAVITSTIVDKQTGAPVRDVCLDAYLPKQASLRDGYGECSDGNGRIQVGPLVGGTYKLFALPQEGAYGRQWVGAEGGTGDERQAVDVVATVGQVTAGPTVRLDPAGTVTGTVTDSTGKPLSSIDISVLTGHPGIGVQDASTDKRGVYTIDRLGPYAWPLVFTGQPWASEWSGDATSRFTATPVTVTAGAAATQDAQLDQGVTLTGTFRTPDGTPYVGGYAIARSVDTGDIAGSGSINDGQFEIRLKGPQRVFFTYNAYLSEAQQVDGRYLVTQPDGTRKLERFTVPASGSMSVDLVVPIG
ncbi:carboxypeptidase regulatory-like domain-containing protein [Micromonospora sp. NPDC000663]|uniref:carboxypeptidase regulatory-like domain-containing protein n=1 Tax=Micromonospora sp. NPDC000663 TaxID=3364218 RepID=UPI0036CECB5C